MQYVIGSALLVLLAAAYRSELPCPRVPGSDTGPYFNEMDLLYAARQAFYDETAGHLVGVPCCGCRWPPRCLLRRAARHRVLAGLPPFGRPAPARCEVLNNAVLLAALVGAAFLATPRGGSSTCSRRPGSAYTCFAIGILAWLGVASCDDHGDAGPALGGHVPLFRATRALRTAMGVTPPHWPRWAALPIPPRAPPLSL